VREAKSIKIELCRGVFTEELERRLTRPRRRWLVSSSNDSRERERHHRCGNWRKVYPAMVRLLADVTVPENRAVIWDWLRRCAICFALVVSLKASNKIVHVVAIIVLQSSLVLIRHQRLKGLSIRGSRIA
jgi:hypothetical protein